MPHKISPEWYVFSRLFIRRHNNFMYHVDWGFRDVLENLGIQYTNYKSNLYFSTDLRIIDRITTSDYDFLQANREILITCIQDCATGIEAKYMNRLDDEEIRILSVALNHRISSMLVSSSDSCI